MNMICNGPAHFAPATTKPPAFPSCIGPARSTCFHGTAHPRPMRILYDVLTNPQPPAMGVAEHPIRMKVTSRPNDLFSAVMAWTLFDVACAWVWSSYFQNFRTRTGTAYLTSLSGARARLSTHRARRWRCFIAPPVSNITGMRTKLAFRPSILRVVRRSACFAYQCFVFVSHAGIVARCVLYCKHKTTHEKRYC